jgi:hypothetical protein
MNINKNYLKESDRKNILSWIVDNEHLKDFSDNTTTNESTIRHAFSVTYTKDNIPELLKCFVESDANVYNFISVVTSRAGDIPEHVDDDLTCYMMENNFPAMYVKMPNTTNVYYVDVCPVMEGGDLVCDDVIVKPETNMMVELPGGTPHAVTQIVKCKRPRVVLVCERYRLLRTAADMLNTPMYRDG